MSRVMTEVGPRLGAALTELHFRYFCDKLAAAICPAYFDYIFRQASSQLTAIDPPLSLGICDLFGYVFRTYSRLLLLSMASF